MRIAICEDEFIFQQNLEKKLQQFYEGKAVEISIFSSGEALLKSYELQAYYDVIFMDIEMQHINGIETAKKIRDYGQQEIIIFLTSHREYAVEGYEVEAMRYLLKPIDEDKLSETLKEISQMLARRKTILVHHSEGEEVIAVEDILYIEAMRNDIYIKIGKRISGEISVRILKLRKTLSQILSQLKSQSFFSCHRSYIVNIQWIESFDARTIKMEDGSQIPMSRGKIKELNQYFMQNI